jgi:hypothetical protein
VLVVLLISIAMKKAVGKGYLELAGGSTRRNLMKGKSVHILNALEKTVNCARRWKIKV